MEYSYTNVIDVIINGHQDQKNLKLVQMKNADLLIGIKRGLGGRRIMGIYYMIINESKEEFLYFQKYNLGVKTFLNPTRALILAWVMECSEWRKK